MAHEPEDGKVQNRWMYPVPLAEPGTRAEGEAATTTHSTAGRLLVGLALVVLLAGCAAGATPSVAKTRDVAYESANSVLVPGELDVYAPVKAGSWPVVVMFHGAPGSSPKTDRSYLGEHARRVADLGFVVFNASWGHAPGGPSALPPTTSSWRPRPRLPVRSSSPGCTPRSTAATRRR